jgi:outer membrane lipoprotein carrier protein
MDNATYWFQRVQNDYNMRSSLKLCLALWWLVLGCPSMAQGSVPLESLSQFLKQTQSGRAQFSQVVTSPTKADMPPRRKTSSGTFEFQRPQQFRFSYTKPFVQTMVSDGQSMWLYDADLNQVTLRKQSGGLGQTPAAFISSTGDLKTLQAEFHLKAEPDSEGLQWVSATPKQAEGSVQTLHLGFKVAAGSVPVLAVLEILDGLGQTSRLSFQNFETNLKLSPDTFQFKPPAGTQVIRP